MGVDGGGGEWVDTALVDEEGQQKIGSHPGFIYTNVSDYKNNKKCQFTILRSDSGGFLDGGWFYFLHF